MVIELLRNIPLFSNLNQRQLTIIQSCCKTINAPVNTVVLHQGENSLDLYIILSGKVKVSWINDDGREVILDILTEGDFFGELSLFDKKPRSATVTAMNNAKIIILPRDAILKTITENPGIAVSMLSVMARRLRKADEKIETLTFLDVSGRVAKVLADLAGEKGERLPDGSIRVQCPTHQIIANQIGASRESVTKALKSLISLGLIKLKGKEIKIRPEQL